MNKLTVATYQVIELGLLTFVLGLILMFVRDYVPVPSQLLLRTPSLLLLARSLQSWTIAAISLIRCSRSFTTGTTEPQVDAQ